MSSTGLDVFDKTLQTTHIWLDELMQEIGPDRQVAWHVLGAVLRAIRDRVPVGLAVHLGSQLPIMVRGAYYDQWRAPGQTLEDPPRSLDAFLAPIAGQLSNIRPVNVRDATRCVFDILSRHVNRGQVQKVRDAMPEQVRALWQENPPDVRARAKRFSSDAERNLGATDRRRVRPRTQKRPRKTAAASPRTRRKSTAGRTTAAKRSRARNAAVARRTVKAVRRKRRT
jgi:uncharacterized protein (DUF2267 family)